MDDCIFCKIASKEIPSEFVFETEKVFAINDLHPKAKKHILVIPKKHYENFDAVNETSIISELFEAVHNITRKFNINDNYRIQINNGKGAGQEVFHLHIHILSNK